MFIANSTFQKTPNLGVSPDNSIWTGPDSTIAHVNAALYSSLALSLFVAFIAMLSKQWLRCHFMNYGSVVERGRDRYRKFKGMKTWHFDFIMESLPLLLQASLFLFSYALSIYLLTINKAIATIAISFISFGLLFYFLIVSAATLSYSCPFQSPLSLYIRSLLGLEDKDKNYLGQAWSWLGRMFFGGPRRSGRPHAPEEDRGDRVKLAIVGPFDQPLRLAAGWTTWGDYVVDTECVAWLSWSSRSTEAVMAIAGLIPEIVWHANIPATTQLERLYYTMLGCFNFSFNPPVVIPQLRDKVYLIAKALVHLAVQRKGIESERDVFQSISAKHRFIGSRHYDTDSDLESTLGMIDRVFKDDDLPLVNWERFSFTVPHHTWMGSILRCYAWRALGNGDPLPVDVEQFVLHSLRPAPPPPASIVAECLHTIGLVLGIRLRDYDQHAIYERSVHRRRVLSWRKLISFAAAAESPPKLVAFTSSLRTFGTTILPRARSPAH